MVRRGPNRLDFRFGPVTPIALFSKLFFEGVLLRFFFFNFWQILGGLGRPTWKPKSIFWRFFFDAFFECISASFLGRFSEARNLKNSNFPYEKQRFSQNRRFRKKCEKTSILESFSEAKTEKNREKTVLKNMCFFHIDFSSLFFDFLRFLLDFGRPRRLQKSIKNGLKKSLVFGMHFVIDFHGFLMDF